MNDANLKPWRWPGQWVRQESFWREVGTRTLATVFAAGLVYVFALAAGYVSRPDVGRVIAYAAIALLYGVAVPNLVARVLARTRSMWIAIAALLVAFGFILGTSMLLEAVGFE